MSRLILLFLIFLSASCSLLPSAKYKYHAVAVGNVQEWNIVRYQIETGKAWFVGKDGLVEIKDEKVQPISEYEFSVTNTVDIKDTQPQIDANWQLIRINTNTGETWWANGARWAKVNESANFHP